jgi:hypothetical protein
MSSDLSNASEEVRASIGQAFRELRPHMVENARLDAPLDPASRIEEFSDSDLGQFVNAYEALFNEALEGSGRETRELIFETALPPLLELGQTAADMMRSNVISAVMLTHRLLPLIPSDQRDDAARWLACFFSTYATELFERISALEAERA